MSRRPPARRRRLSLRGLLAAGLLLLALWGGGDLAFVTLGAEDDHAAPADTILVLGCSVYGEEGIPSPCIRARAGQAAALYHQGLAPVIIASGGPVGPDLTEAGVLAGVLQEEGVPAAAIIRETESRDTIQNIYNSRVILAAHGWRTAILVTEPYHINRAGLIARDAGLRVYPSPALASPVWQSPSSRVLNLLEDAGSLMLYQVKTTLGIRN